MNNNPELGDNRPANDEANKWDILPKDNFYQHQQASQEAPNSELSDDEVKQILIAKKRSEALKNNHEARQKAKRAAATLLGLALSATVVVGNIVATKPHDDFLKSEQAKQKVIEMENAKEIVFHGNVRSNPEIPNSEDPNIYSSIDEEVKLSVPDDSTILYYRDENDPNGGWFGVSVKNLEEQSFISKREARQLEKDHDGYAWINQNNAHVTITPE